MASNKKVEHNRKLTEIQQPFGRSNNVFRSLLHELFMNYLNIIICDAKFRYVAEIGTAS